MPKRNFWRLALRAWPVGVGMAALAWGCASEDSARAGKPDASGGLTPCKADAECPAGQGCETSSGSDAYCAPLCSAPEDCPKGYDCPGLVLGATGSCAESGAHAGGKGVCDLFAGTNGPNSCISGSGDAGSGDAGSEGGGGGDCVAFCNAWIPEECANHPPRQGCLDECEERKAAWGTLCPSELQAFSDCMTSAKIGCDEYGRVYGGDCDLAEFAVYKCVGCYIAPGEPPCSKCLRTSCCDELNQFNNDPHIVDFIHCATPCTSASCVDQCSALYPSAAAANKARYDCTKSKCAADCQ